MWKDVKDELPPDYHEVLFFAVNHSGTKEIMTGHREYGLWLHCCWFYSSMKCDNTITVTHWMELPEYPTMVLEADKPLVGSLTVQGSNGRSLSHPPTEEGVE